MKLQSECGSYQIWFQNRRQSSRRKSRPLLPHEIARYQFSGSATGSRTCSSESPPSSDASNQSHAKSEDLAVNEGELSREVEIGRTEGLQEYEKKTAPGQAGFSGKIVKTVLSSSFRRVQRGHSHCPDKVDATMRPAGAPGYLANRRSAPYLGPRQSFGRADTVQDTAPGREIHKKERTASFVRLSMTSEGGAMVTTKDASSPSPPRPQQVLLLTTSISRQPMPSLAGLTALSSQSPKELAPRTSTGHSRDSRAWEFWCDKDARVELEKKAEKDASGSAADAIGLLRSASGRKVLQPISAKRNLFPPKHQPSRKRSKLEQHMPLERSNTSRARLQASVHDDFAGPHNVHASLKLSRSAASAYIPGNDSDKENWSPLSTATSDELDAPRRSLAGRDPEADPELASFMRGSKSAAVSATEDMDCVQGLLSLSQGNWR